MPVIACPHCRTSLEAPVQVYGTEVVCGQCRQKFLASPPPPAPAVGEAASAEAPAAPTPPPVPAPPAVRSPMSAAPTAGAAIASLVLGIVSIASCLTCGPPASIVCGILAIVFRYTTRRAIAEGRAGGPSNGLAVAGMVCGWIGLALGLLAMAYLVVTLCIGAFPSHSGTWSQDDP